MRQSVSTLKLSKKLNEDTMDKNEPNDSIISRAKAMIRFKLYLKSSLLIVTLVLILFPTCLDADKYAGEIFRIGAGVRNFALGNTGVSDYQSTSLAYWNPSLLAKDGVNRLELMHSEEFLGAVNYDTFSLIWGDHNRYSLVLTRIGIDGIPLTKLPNPEESVSTDNQPYVYKTVNNADYIAYFGLYRRLGNYVIGITPKIAYRYLAETSGWGFGADIATHFDLHADILLGINVRDFFSTQVFWDNGTHEIIKPGLDVELNISFPNYIIGNKSRLLLGTEIITEGRKESATHNIGSFSFDYHIGLEIPLPEYVSLYAGYDVDNFTTGVSLNIYQFQVNYAFKYNTELDNSHRISLGYNFQPVNN